MAFGPNGHVYVAERFSGRIYDVASDGSKTIFASGLTDPVFIKFNVAGDLFVGEWAPRNLKRVSPAGVVSMYAANLSPVTQEVGDFWIMPSGEI